MKSRVQRMQVVNHLAEKKEQQSAQIYSQCLASVSSLEQQLEKLYSYRQAYSQQLTEQSRLGVANQRLQDTLMFMSNLNKSIDGVLSQIKQQKQFCEIKKQNWLVLHQQTKTYLKVTQKYQISEQIQINKNEQKMMDEFNQSAFHRKHKPI